MLTSLSLKKNCPKEDATKQDEANGQTSADYSPGDECDVGPEVVIDDDEDDADSLQVNYDRYPTDLPRLRQPAFCIDTDTKVSRYLLFKIAQFTADHFVTPEEALSREDRQRKV